MFDNFDLQEFLVALGIFASGSVLAWLVALVVVTVEERASSEVRAGRSWRRAHRLALFWLLLVIAISVAIRSVSAAEEYRSEVDQTTTVIGTILGSLAVIHSANQFLAWYVRSHFRIRPFLSSTALPIVQRFVTITITVLAVVYLLDALSQPVTPILAVLSIGGFGIALAFRDTLANFFASTTLVSDGSIRVGDSVEIESEHGVWGPLMGTVVGIGWRNTRIVTRTNNIVTVPNGKLAENLVTNYSVPSREMGVVVRAGVASGTDLDRVEVIALEVAVGCQESHARAAPRFQPTFAYERFGDNGIEFALTLRARSFDDSAPFVSDFIKVLSACFAEESIPLALAGGRAI